MPMRLRSRMKILSFAVIFPALGFLPSAISATTCIYKDVNNSLACTDTNIYDCKSNLKGNPEYDKTCAELEGRPAEKYQYDPARDSKYNSCLNSCNCSGYQTQAGIKSCLDSCRSSCVR